MTRIKKKLIAIVAVFVVVISISLGIGLGLSLKTTTKQYSLIGDTIEISKKNLEISYGEKLDQSSFENNTWLKNFLNPVSEDYINFLAPKLIDTNYTSTTEVGASGINIMLFFEANKLKDASLESKTVLFDLNVKSVVSTNIITNKNVFTK